MLFSAIFAVIALRTLRLKAFEHESKKLLTAKIAKKCRKERKERKEI
jgi:hypothetical protein